MSGETEKDVSGWTVDTLHSRVNALRDEVTLDLAALEKIIETRLDGMDRASALLNDNMTRVPTDVDKQIAHLKALHGEKFASIDTRFEDVAKLRGSRFDAVSMQIAESRGLYDEKFHSIAVQFTERDTRAEQTSRDSKVAVDAALQAAKEAVGEQNKSSALAISKSEAATNKQLDQVSTQISNSVEALNDKLNDLKSRLDRGDGQASQVVVSQTERRYTRVDSQWVTSAVISGLALLISVIVAIVIVSRR